MNPTQSRRAVGRLQIMETNLMRIQKVVGNRQTRTLSYVHVQLRLPRNAILNIRSEIIRLVFIQKYKSIKSTKCKWKNCNQEVNTSVYVSRISDTRLRIEKIIKFLRNNTPEISRSSSSIRFSDIQLDHGCFSHCLRKGCFNKRNFRSAMENDILRP